MAIGRIKKLLEDNNQNHILRFWDSYNDEQRKKFLSQIESIDFTLLKQLYKQATLKKDSSQSIVIERTDVISFADRAKRDPEMILKGEELLRSGKIAAFLVAGGQGSRLGFDGPKGIYPITPVKKKSLFQLHAEKILAYNRLYNTIIPWYIMTSVGNHDETITYFENNHYFGLNKKNVMFFKQEMIAALDKKGKLLLEARDKIFMNPNGHGGSLKAIWDSNAFQDMKNRGIQAIFYFQVDNVLTHICDPAFIGYHVAYKSQMSNKVVRKAYPEEKMGIICSLNGKTGVVEYSDLSAEDTYALDENGALKYWAGSIAIHLIDVSFIEKINKRGFRLPYHIAEKKIPYINKEGLPIKSDTNNGYKFETFVFDALQHCDRTISLEVSRADEFSPLKNKSGVDSEETAIKDMSRLYLKWLKNAGLNVPDFSNNFPNTEISPLFANTERELKNKKKQLPVFQENLFIGD